MDNNVSLSPLYNTKLTKRNMNKSNKSYMYLNCLLKDPFSFKTLKRSVPTSKCRDDPLVIIIEHEVLSAETEG